jgi:hypothetical protein
MMEAGVEGRWGGSDTVYEGDSRANISFSSPVLILHLSLKIYRKPVLYSSSLVAL